MTLMMNEPKVKLRKYIEENGPVQAVRVSSAQAKGVAKRYCYWGAVRYEIRVNYYGILSSVAQEKASSDRRSMKLAIKDAFDLAKKEKRVYLRDIGPISEQTAWQACQELGIN